jgi:hypothetical protein
MTRRATAVPSARRHAWTFDDMICWYQELQPTFTARLKELASTFDHGELSLH